MSVNPGLAPGAVAGLVEEPRDRLQAPVLQEEVVDEAPDQGFLGMRHELSLHPVVAEGTLAAEGLAELRPDGHRGRDSGPVTWISELPSDPLAEEADPSGLREEEA